MANCVHNPHDVVFYGALNLNFHGKIVGSVDIWLCKKCRDLFWEDKRFTDLKPTTELGFRGPGEGAKWGVLTCYSKKDVNWVVLSVRPGQKLEHQCLDPAAPEVDLSDDWRVTHPVSENVTHKVIIVEQHINKAVEITTV